MPVWEPLRRALGQIRAWSERINLAAMTPQPELASTGYCLATRNSSRPELLIYVPESGQMRIDLRTIHGLLKVEIFDTESGRLARSPSIEAGVWWGVQECQRRAPDDVWG